MIVEGHPNIYHVEAYEEVISLCERAIKTIDELPAGLKKGSSNFHNGKVAAYREIIAAVEQRLKNA